MWAWFLSKYISAKLGHALPAHRPVSSLGEAATEPAHCFTLSEIEDATRKFEKKIGSGGFGVVYYGKMKDGKEIAVKILTSNSYQGKREFQNEVNVFLLLVAIHFIPFFPYLFLFLYTFIFNYDS